MGGGRGDPAVGGCFSGDSQLADCPQVLTGGGGLPCCPRSDHLKVLPCMLWPRAVIGCEQEPWGRGAACWSQPWPCSSCCRPFLGATWRKVSGLLPGSSNFLFFLPEFNQLPKCARAPCAGRGGLGAMGGLKHWRRKRPGCAQGSAGAEQTDVKPWHVHSPCSASQVRPR